MTISTLGALYRRWIAALVAADEAGADDPRFAALCGKLIEIENSIAAAPVVTTLDYAIKITIALQDGWITLWQDALFAGARRHVGRAGLPLVRQAPGRASLEQTPEARRAGQDGGLRDA